MAAFLGGLDLATHSQIQKLCLSVCSRMTRTERTRTDAYADRNGGRALVPQVACDVVAVMRLEMEVLVFNLSDFFAQGGLTTLMPAAIP